MIKIFTLKYDSLLFQFAITVQAVQLSCYYWVIIISEYLHRIGTSV